MTETLTQTTVTRISKRINRLRTEQGVTSLGRVLTLVVITPEPTMRSAMRAASDAALEHPMRIIVVSIPPEDPGSGDQSAGSAPARLDANRLVPDRLDADLHIGPANRSSEIIVLRPHGRAADDVESLLNGLLLPDVPIAVWWPGADGARVAGWTDLPIATRHITTAQSTEDPVATLHRLADVYRPGDTDLAWSEITLWRGQLAAALDDAPQLPVDRVQVRGAAHSAARALLATWLGRSLDARVTVSDASDRAAPAGVSEVVLHRADGPVSLTLGPGSPVARLSSPGIADQFVPLQPRALSDCLAEELRHMQDDPLYGAVLHAVPDICREEQP